jgi:hypothetical protein
MFVGLEKMGRLQKRSRNGTIEPSYQDASFAENQRSKTGGNRRSACQNAFQVKLDFKVVEFIYTFLLLFLRRQVHTHQIKLSKEENQVYQKILDFSRRALEQYIKKQENKGHDDWKYDQSGKSDEVGKKDKPIYPNTKHQGR